MNLFVKCDIKSFLNYRKEQTDSREELRKLNPRWLKYATTIWCYTRLIKLVFWYILI